MKLRLFMIFVMSKSIFENSDEIHKVLKSLGLEEDHRPTKQQRVHKKPQQGSEIKAPEDEVSRDHRMVFENVGAMRFQSSSRVIEHHPLTEKKAIVLKKKHEMTMIESVKDFETSIQIARNSGSNLILC
jgi:hypothetical protein